MVLLEVQGLLQKFPDKQCYEILTQQPCRIKCLNYVTDVATSIGYFWLV